MSAPRFATVASPAPPQWLHAILGIYEERARVRGLVFFELSSEPLEKLDDPSAFGERVARSYRQLEALVEQHGCAPLRFWNYVPRICDPFGDGQTRYEVFNAARRSVNRTGVLGAPAAASAIDIRDPRFVVQLLAGPAPAVGVANPRQIQPWDYSRVYGAVPPSFFRGAALRADVYRSARLPAGFVAGTASILGERTHHAGDLAGQLHETTLNLACVSAGIAGCARSWPLGHALDREVREALDRYQALRVYVVREQDETAIRRFVSRQFAKLESAEFVHADLCRPDLLVEIEGMLRSGV
jgi:chorismate lyase / 3-hydroxybenzoate synthase